MSYPFTPVLAMQRQAVTPFAGYTLINGTGNIITWTAPNDGQLHRFYVESTLSITSAETGGNIVVSWVTPDGNTPSQVIYFGGTGISQPQPATWNLTIIKPGSTVAVSQSTPLTAGAAVLWAEIWGF